MRPGLSLKEECEIKRREADTDSKLRDDRDRDRSPNMSNRTDSEDPKLLSSRVFLGNLATDKTSRAELEEKYSKYGNILGVAIFRGFGFIQFKDESDARKAVEMENGGLFKGQRLDVKMAAEGRKQHAQGRGGPGGARRSPPPRGRRDDRDFDRRPGPPSRDGRDRDRSPLRSSRDRSPAIRDGKDPYARREDGYDRRDPYAEDPYRRAPPPAGRDPYYERLRDDPYRRDPYPPPPAPYRDPYRDPYAAPLPPPAPATSYEAPPAVDCEILMLSRTIRDYGEGIRLRLKGHGIISELVALADEAALKPAIEGVSRRGLPFAIVLNSQNAMHRSCTVSILHGTPQEHRNMPLDDALSLVARSFETYLKEQKEKAAKAAGASPAGQYQHLPPEAQMQYLLNLLADNHYLTAEELGKVIEYLQDRKKRVIAHEGGPEAIAQEHEKTINKQQQELQAKILSILGPDANSGAKEVAAARVQAVHPPPPPTSNSQAINFDSPSVQQALDNLISSGPNLLRNISVVAKDPQAAAPRVAAAPPPPQPHPAAVAYPRAPYAQAQAYPGYRY